MKTRWLLLVIFVFALAAVPLAQTQAQATANIRVAHLSPDAPAVEIYINGSPSDIQQLSFPDITGWVEIPAGTYEIAVVPVGAPLSAAAIGPLEVTLTANSWQTIAAIGSLQSDTLTADIITEDYSPITAGEARVTIYHGIESAPEVDVIVNGDRPLTGLAFGNSVTTDLPAATYDLQVAPTGTDSILLDLPATPLDEGVFYFVAAVGIPTEPGVLVAAVSSSLIGSRLAPASGTIADVAAADGRFTTLLTAVEAANLTSTLSGAGNFTVFAPTDTAFAALPAEELNALLANPAALRDVLLYHVVGERFTSRDVARLTSITTAQGGDISVTVTPDGVFLNDTTQVIITDIEASNGIIHVIDAVLLPPAE